MAELTDEEFKAHMEGFIRHHLPEARPMTPTPEQTVINAADELYSALVDRETTPGQHEAIAEYAKARNALTAAAGVESDRCVSDHLWQETGSGGSMGKAMRCDKCGKTKYVPW
jgi:hypothetical protein